MTAQEAINMMLYRMNTAIEIVGKGEDGNTFEDMEMAIKALEKQIPTHPIYGKFDNNGFDEIIPCQAVCPTCGHEFEFGIWNDEENHHCICGQRMNWMDNDFE